MTKKQLIIVCSAVLVTLLMGVTAIILINKTGNSTTASPISDEPKSEIGSTYSEVSEEESSEEESSEEQSSNVSSEQSSTSSVVSATTPTIPAFSSETINRLMSLDNTKKGFGWAGAENRQDYYAQYNAFAVGDQTKKTVYLTFDEGYEYKYTPAILDVLKEKDVKAVFFVTMSYVKNNPELIKRMIDEGHIVGNHSVNHPSFPTCSLDKAYNEVKELHDYMQKNYNYTMTLFRFPMGESSDRMLALLQEMGYKSVFWNFAHRDWETDNQPDKEAAKASIAKYTKNGTIFLLHAVSQTNTEILGEVIDDIRAKGYTLELFK